MCSSAAKKGRREAPFFVYEQRNFLELFLKYPLLIKHKACDDIYAVGDDVCEEAGFHELRNEVGERFAPGGVQNVNGGFERYEVQGVGRKEHDDESDDFGALAVVALEVPNAVHQVAVDGAENEPEKVRKFQVPVEYLVHYPDRGEGNERVHNANQVVFDKMFHTGKSKKLFLRHYDLV